MGRQMAGRENGTGFFAMVIVSRGKIRTLRNQRGKNGLGFLGDILLIIDFFGKKFWASSQFPIFI